MPQATPQPMPQATPQPSPQAMPQPWLDPSPSNDNWRPIAYLTLKDSALCARLTAALEHHGWTVVRPPTGFHLVQSLADVIDGHRLWLRPSLIVMDVRSPGCSGLSLATGLHDLGIAIPILLVTPDGEPLAAPEPSPPSVRIAPARDSEPIALALAAALTGTDHAPLAPARAAPLATTA